MKNTFKTIISLTLLLCLNSCNNDNNYNIEELIFRLNEYSEYNLTTDDFLITKNDRYIYSTVINKNILLTLYCNEKNEITSSTITTNKKTNKDFEHLWKSVASILINKTDLNQAKIIKDTNIEGWIIKEIVNNIGTTMLISRVDNPIHHNNNPTLKEDISN